MRARQTVIFLGFSAIIFMPILWFPNYNDQGFYSYVSWVWLKFGEKPYVLPPGIHCIYALAFKLFGFNTLGIHILDYLGQILDAVLILFLVSKLCGKTLPAFLAVTVYAGFYVFQLGYLGTMEPEGMALAFLLLAAFFYIALHGRLAGAALAGLMLGCSFLVKPTFCLAGPVFFALYFYSLRKAKAAAPRIAAAEFILTFFALLPWLAVLAAYYHWGCLGKLYQGLWVLNKDLYVGAQSRHLMAAARSGTVVALLLFYYFGPVGLPVILLLLPDSSTNLRQSDPGLEKNFLLCSLIAVGLLSELSQSKTTLYHMIPFLAFCSIYSGIGYYKLFEVIGRGRHPAARLALGALLFALIFLVSSSKDRGGDIINLLRSGYHPLGKAYERSSSTWPEARYYEVASYIRDSTKPDDLVQGFGYLYNINFIAQRKMPTIYYDWSLLLPFPWSLEESKHPLILEWRGKFMQDLESRPPVYFVVRDHPAQGLDYLSQMERIPGLKEFFGRNYHLEKQFGVIKVYRKN